MGSVAGAWPGAWRPRFLAEGADVDCWRQLPDTRGISLHTWEISLHTWEISLHTWEISLDTREFLAESADIHRHSDVR